MEANKNLDLILLLDGNRGIYIPKDFQRYFNPQNSYWVWDYDNSDDLMNPENEFYWETWDDILETAYMVDPNTGIKYTLYQDLDLWAVPEGYEWPED